MTDFKPGDIVDVTIRGAKIVDEGYYGFICVEGADWIDPNHPDVTVTPHVEADGQVSLTV